MLIETIFVEGNGADIADFYIGKYPITQAQWKAVMGHNPSYFDGDNCPVECVSWYDVQEFIRKLNAMSGQTYRLPTDAEWEYAARGGQHSEGYEYAGSNDADEVAWHWNNSGGRTHPVGHKKPNELGLYDMSGNVWEWCGVLTDVETRVLRGGSWYYRKRVVARASVGNGVNPYGKNYTVGLRVAHD